MTFVYVATLKPFVMDSPSQFRPGPAPALTSERYAKDYNEVLKVGGTLGHPAAGACPAPADTDMARFWGANIPVQWNQVLRDVAVSRQLGIGDTARLLALANLAGCRRRYRRLGQQDPLQRLAADHGHPPGQRRRQRQDRRRHQLDSVHLERSLPGRYQGPPYPDYVSGANGVTGAYTTMLQLFFKTDNLAFEIYKTSPPTVAICTNPRLYRRLSEAAEEVVDARVLLGIHFRFADTAARTLGTRVAWHTFTNALRPIRKDWNTVRISEAARSEGLAHDRAGAPGAIASCRRAVLGRRLAGPRQRTSLATSRSVIEPSSECENAATNALRVRFTIAGQDIGVGVLDIAAQRDLRRDLLFLLVLQDLRRDVHEAFPGFAERP